MNLRSCPRLSRALLLATALLAASWNAVADSAPACPPAAQPPTPEQMQTGMKTARDRGFLWRLRKDGRTSYLYGTVHVAKLDWMYPGATLMSALRASDLIALELDLLDPDIMERLRAGMAWRPERAVEGRLADRLQVQLKAACLPEQMMTTMTPEMVATTLVVMAGRRDGLDPAYAIDIVMAGLGRGLKKPVSSLETPELQLKLLQGRSPQEAQAIVEQALEELESGRATPALRRIAQVWADGRFGELEHYAQWCDCLNTEEERVLYRRMLDERNPGLADRIDAIHAGGKQVFAAVGSLHMIGPLGLPSLFMRRGYQVERIDLKP